MSTKISEMIIFYEKKQAYIRKKAFFYFPVFLTIFIINIVVHFVVLATTIYNHDSITLSTNSFDWLLRQGKWFVNPIASLEGPIDISYSSHIIGLAVISVAAIVTSELYRIKTMIGSVLIGIVFVTFPSVATMALFHALDIFGITMLLSVLSAYFITNDKAQNRILGVFLLTLTIGIYQPYLGLMVALIEINGIILLFQEESLQDYLKKILKWLVDVVVSLKLYYLILKIKLMITGVKLDSYKGMDQISSNLMPTVLIKKAFV